MAYADPPYPGQAKRHYADHPDYAGEVDHGELMMRLEAIRRMGAIDLIHRTQRGPLRCALPMFAWRLGSSLSRRSRTVV